jgi:2-aminoadipate transaminase
LSKTATFDGAPPAGTINLGIGQPSADLLPVDVMREASDAFYADAVPLELNYGVSQGDERFLKSLARFLSAGYGSTADPADLMVTGGNSQAMDMAAMVFSKPGDTIFVEEPTYFLAHSIFRDHGLNIVGIPVDDDGLCLDALQEELTKQSPAFLYTIASYHNPGGQCTSESRRLQAVELAREHDFLIIADEVYQLLHYFDPPPPAYGTMINSNHVVSLGSFSKILAPGIRLGWIQTAPQLKSQILGSGLINSGGSINHLGSHIVRKTIDLGLLDSHIEKLRDTYRGRVEAMDEALQEHFDGLATWTRPNGGYFFWLQFDEAVDTSRLRSKAREAETGFQSGSVFSSKGELKNFARLCFAHYDDADIREGIARLRPLFDQPQS